MSEFTSADEVLKKKQEQWSKLDPKTVKASKIRELQLRQLVQKATGEPDSALKPIDFGDIFQKANLDIQKLISSGAFSKHKIYAHDDTDGYVASIFYRNLLSMNKSKIPYEIIFAGNYDKIPASEDDVLISSIDMAVPGAKILIDHHDASENADSDAKLYLTDMINGGGKKFFACASNISKKLADSLENTLIGLPEFNPNQLEKRSPTEYRLEEILSVTGLIGDNSPAAVKYCADKFQKKTALKEADADIYSPRSFEMMRDLSLYLLLKIPDVKNCKMKISELDNQASSIAMRILGYGKGLAEPDFDLFNINGVDAEAVRKVKNIVSNAELFSRPDHYFVVLEKQNFKHATGVVANYLSCYSKLWAALHFASKYVHNPASLFRELENRIDNSSMFVAEELGNGKFKISYRGYSTEEIKEMIGLTESKIGGRGKVGGGIITETELKIISAKMNDLRSGNVTPMKLYGDLLEERMGSKPYAVQ